MKGQQGPQMGGDFRTNLARAHFIVQALACTVEVFLHNPGSFGARYFGPQAAVGAVIMFVFPLLASGASPAPMWCMAMAFLFLCGVNRAKARQRELRGEPTEHSYYNGQPALWRVARKFSEDSIKRALEPALTIIAGAALSDWNQPLGAYLVITAIALVLSNSAAQRVARGRALDLNDAHLEQRRTVDTWRRMRGE